MTDRDAPLAAEEAWRTAFDACLEGYPLLVLDAARRRHPVEANRFIHARPGETAVGLCAPNPHVVYSSAWLDLREGPVIVSLPDLRARHLAMPMIDASGSIFTSMGVRRHGESARHLVVVGPHWSGCGTDDLPAVRAPTNVVWLLGRTLTDSFDDSAAGPWNDYFLTVKGRRAASGDPVGSSMVPPAGSWPAWPAAEFSRMDAEEFLSRMAPLMDVHPAPPTRWSLGRRLARLGVSRTEAFRLDRLPAPIADAVAQGLAAGLARIEAAAEPLAADAATGGWVRLARPGEGRLDAISRAAVVRRGFGFHLQEDMVYFLAARDDADRSLDGQCAYRLRFEPRRLPPVGAYWSVVAYHPDGRPLDRSADRQGLSSRDPLRFDLDGSLEIRLQARRPAGPRAMNWLPIPEGPFHLVLRTCWPGSPVLEGRWNPPPVARAAAERTAPRARLRPGPSPSGGPAGQLRDRPDSPLAATP